MRGLALLAMVLLVASVGATKCSHTTCRLASDARSHHKVIKVRHHNRESVCGRWQTLSKGELEEHAATAQKQCALVPGGVGCECHVLGTHPGSHFRGAPPTKTVSVSLEMRGINVPDLTAAAQGGIKAAFKALLHVLEARVLVRNARSVRIASAMARRLRLVSPVDLVGKDLVQAADAIVDSAPPPPSDHALATGWHSMRIASVPTGTIVVDVLVNFWTAKSANAAVATIEQTMSSSSRVVALSRSIRQRVMDAVIAAGENAEGMANLASTIESVAVLKTAVFSHVPKCNGGTTLTKDCADYGHGNNHQVTSAKTCDALGWTTKHGRSARVCAASHCRGELKQQRGGGAATSTTFDEAERLCRASGARLCTADELEANESAGTGCSHDGRRVWSSSPCGHGKAYLQFGRRPKSGNDKTCTDHSAGSGYVRCCADVEVVTPTATAATRGACVAACEVSAKCAGWAFGSSHGSQCFLLDAAHLQLGATPHAGFVSATCTDNEVCTRCENDWQASGWHAPPAHPCEIKSCALGTFLNARQNKCETCPNAFVATEWVTGMLCKIKQCAQEEGWVLDAAQNKCKRCENRADVAAWMPGADCRVVQCAADAFLNPWSNRCESYRIKWKRIFASGTHGTQNVGASEFQALMLQSPSRMVKRVCPDCPAGFKTVVYKRKGDSAIDFNSIFHASFPRFNNKIHVDFNLYSSVADAEADKNQWQRCIYGTAAPLFPYACTKQASVVPHHPAGASENFSLFLDVSQFHERSRVLPKLKFTKVFSVAPPGKQSSRKSCNDLGWKTGHGTSAAVCAASHCRGKIAQQGGGGEVVGTTFDEAQSMCHSEGARLCTAEELEANETAGTGCGLDRKRIWSSTSCAWGASYVMVGRSTAAGGKKELCAHHSSKTGHVRCCADLNNNFDAGRAAFQAAAEKSQYRLIKRTCLECDAEYRDVVYLRTGPDLADYYSTFLGAFTRRRNVLHRHFELFSSVNDALARRNMWDWCRYESQAPGAAIFPYACGKNGGVTPHHWNTLTPTSNRTSFAYFVSN